MGGLPLVTQSLLDCKINSNDSLIVCLDANLRTFYGALKDGPGEGLPPVPSDAAVVRIRADHQVAQISGNHTLSPNSAHYIGTKVGAFQSCESASVFYFVSPSKQYGSVPLTAREHKIRRIRTRPARSMAAVGRNRNHDHNARGI